MKLVHIVVILVSLSALFAWLMNWSRSSTFYRRVFSAARRRYDPATITGVRNILSDADLGRDRLQRRLPHSGMDPPPSTIEIDRPDVGIPRLRDVGIPRPDFPLLPRLRVDCDSIGPCKGYTVERNGKTCCVY